MLRACLFQLPPGLVNVTLAGEDKKRFEEEIARLSKSQERSQREGKSQEAESDVFIEVIGLINYLQD